MSMDPEECLDTTLDRIEQKYNGTDNAGQKALNQVETSNAGTDIGPVFNVCRERNEENDHERALDQVESDEGILEFSVFLEDYESDCEEALDQVEDNNAEADVVPVADHSEEKDQEREDEEKDVHCERLFEEVKEDQSQEQSFVPEERTDVEEVCDRWTTEHEIKTAPKYNLRRIRLKTSKLAVMENNDVKRDASKSKKQIKRQKRKYNSRLSSQEQREQHNMKTKLRMREYRKRLKEKANATGHVQTKKEKELKEKKQAALREQWRLQKRKWRNRNKQRKKGPENFQILKVRTLSKSIDSEEHQETDKEIDLSKMHGLKNNPMNINPRVIAFGEVSRERDSEQALDQVEDDTEGALDHVEGDTEGTALVPVFGHSKEDEQETGCREALQWVKKEDEETRCERVFDEVKEEQSREQSSIPERTDVGGLKLVCDQRQTVEDEVGSKTAPKYGLRRIRLKASKPAAMENNADVERDVSEGKKRLKRRKYNSHVSSQEQKQQHNLKTKLRMREYRKRLKEKANAVGHVQTKKEKELKEKKQAALREQWRLQKRRWRNRNKQKKAGPENFQILKVCTLSKWMDSEECQETEEIDSLNGNFSPRFIVCKEENQEGEQTIDQVDNEMEGTDLVLAFGHSAEDEQETGYREALQWVKKEDEAMHCEGVFDEGQEMQSQQQSAVSEERCDIGRLEVVYDRRLTAEDDVESKTASKYNLRIKLRTNKLAAMEDDCDVERGASEQDEGKKRIKREMNIHQLSPQEQKEWYNMKAKLRMREYRKRLKEKAKVAGHDRPKKKKVSGHVLKKRKELKDKNQAAVREQWRLQKRKWRSTINQRKAEPNNSTKPEEYTLSTVNQVLPEDPQKWCEIISQVISSASPEKRRQLAEKGLVYSPPEHDKNEKVAK